MKVYGSTISGNVVSENSGKKELGKDAFLKILSAQLKNQDPMNAGSNTEYISQMAQFTSLEQLQNLNTTIMGLFTSEKFLGGNMMIGKIAKVTTDGNNYITGEVTGTRLAGDTVNVVIDGKEYNVDGVVEISNKESGGVVV